MKVPFSNLADEFRHIEEIDFRSVVETSDFTLGAKVQEFELKFAEYIGVAHAIGVGSGTDAIKLSLVAAGVKRGDEVIVPAETFVATLGAVVEIGAVPVLVDVRDDFCINPELIKAAITDKTKAIVPVHLTGEMADMPKILDIVRGTTIVVVEDACQALGASLHPWMGLTVPVSMKMAGNWGHLAAFSFHPMKNLCVWGDGGMITTNDEDYAHKLRLLRNHGLATRDRWECFGYNSRLDTIQAAVGLWMLPKLGEIVANRQGNAHGYHAHMPMTGVDFPRMHSSAPLNPMAGHACHLYMIRVDAKIRDNLVRHLNNAGVEAKIHYTTPLWKQRALALKCQLFAAPVAAQHAKTVISLPVHHHLTVEQLQYVCDTIKEFFKEEKLVIPKEMRGKIPPVDELRPSPQDIHDVWERTYSKADVEILDAVMADLCREFPNEWWEGSEYAHLVKRLPRTGEKEETPTSAMRELRPLIDAAISVAEMPGYNDIGRPVEDIRVALEGLGVPYKRG